MTFVKCIKIMSALPSIVFEVEVSTVVLDIWIRSGCCDWSSSYSGT